MKPNPFPVVYQGVWKRIGIWRALAVAWAAHLMPLAAQTEGTRQWAYSINGYTGSTPALSPDGETIYVGVEALSGSSGRVLAIPRDGGRERWSQIFLQGPILSSPAVTADGRTLYVGSDDGFLYALNAANGAIRWRFDTKTFVESSPAIGPDGTIYFGGGDSKLHALTDHGNQATERWAFETGDWITSSPAIGADGTIYFGSYDQKFYAVTPAGERKWDFTTAGIIQSSPAIGRDGTLYFGSADQRVYALAPDGTKKWEYFTNGDVQASPSLGADGTVYIASFDLFLYALNPGGPDADRVKWRARLNASTNSTAAVRGDGVVIVGADGSQVFAFNPDGTPRWVFNAGTEDIVESSPLIAPDGSIYIGFLDGFVYKIHGNGSPMSAYSPWPTFGRDLQRTRRAAPPTGSGRLLNLSTRAVTGGNGSLIAGFFIQGTGPKVYLMRGIGPALGQFGVGGFLRDPRLDLFSGGRPLPGASNDNWGDDPSGTFGVGAVVDASVELGAFPLPAGSRDAALLAALSPGLYTALITSVDGSTGVALVEAYDARGGDASARLMNLSTRGPVGIDENALFAGVAVGGTGPSHLLVRAVGPGLSQFGVPGVLARPTMSVFASGVFLRGNTGWNSEGFQHDLASAGEQVGAFRLGEGSNDSAMIVRVLPGLYTIQVTGAGGTTGEALVEIYMLP